MIKCPITGKAVPTGFGADQQSFESSSYSQNTFGPCPACGKMHTWDKKDAWLQG
jgi:endogenous inhibitor of DNA gyrase (YacG/DUF329 family)